MESIKNTLRRVRLAKDDDIPSMMLMYANSKRIMRTNSNMNQWCGNYPDQTLLLDDIHRKVSYIIEEIPISNNGAPSTIGCFAFILGKDHTYNYIEDGNWQDDEVPYGTIHRLACAANRHGIADTCFDFCDRHAPSLRVDTHADNTIMQHIAERQGFSYRGIIYIDDGTQRKAYQRLNPHHLMEELNKYVEENILPRYDNFDAAHQQNHIRSVIRRSFEMAQHYDVNLNMIYTAAAYHDTGVCEGREHHHIVSGRIIREDSQLRTWFSPNQIETIAQAAEDHRASSHNKPRSLYGLILAEADRDLDCHLVVQRTVQYSLSHYPSYSKEQHWQRTLSHLQEKYSTTGYLTIYLPDSPNVKPMTELHELIANEAKLRELFEKIYAEEL